MIEYIACGIVGAVFGAYLKDENTKEMKPERLDEYDLDRERPSDFFIKMYLHKKEHKEEMMNYGKDDFNNVRYVQYAHNEKCGTVIYNLPIGELGAMSYMLNENYQPFSGDGFHKINLDINRAKTGSSEYRFLEHIRFIESGNAKVFMINGDR